jgi:hypothetical protein
MELIQRYLQAIEFWLPKKQQRDIIAELSDDIRAQVEERETELGRALTEAEVAELLRKRGRPVLVANRYLPQEHLIGPLLFPIYRFVLQIVGLCCLIPWAVGWLSMILFKTSYWSFGAMWGSLWTTLFVAMGTVTLIFAILERVQTGPRTLEVWDPRKLPPLRNPNQIPRVSSSIEFAVNLVFLTWWADYFRSPIALNYPPVRMVLAPVWSYIYWGFLLVALLNTAMAASSFIRPYWTVRRAWLRLISDAAGSALFCWLLKANVLLEMSVANVSAARSMEIANAMNWWMEKMFPAAVLAGVVIAGFDLYRILRVKEQVEGPVGDLPHLIA